jgi:hypothetical protein
MQFDRILTIKLITLLFLITIMRSAPIERDLPELKKFEH